VNVSSLAFHSIVSQDKGIANAFEAWKQSGGKKEERFSFYLDIIKEHITRLEQQEKISIKDAPLVISGMASSSMGMMDIPYKKIPFKMDGSGLEYRKIKKTKDFTHDMLIISGAKTSDDAMRGEETQLIGCTHHKGEQRLFIFPGTHSKHILVKKGRVIDCKTYMTGEFFDLLSSKSILSGSVREEEGLNDRDSKKAFKKGIDDSGQSILHTAFGVRTNYLFKKMTKQENYYYLSGLLIGTELKEVIQSNYKKITLVVNESMKPFYVTALKMMGIKKTKNSFLVEDVDTTLVRGQLKIWESLYH
jgi:2-dehydro-3-deoxygalactonokinase